MYMKPGGLVLRMLDCALDPSQQHIMSPSRGRLLTSLFSLLSSGIANIVKYNDSHQDFPLAPDVVEKYMQKWLLFSVVWGFGGSMTAAGRAAMCDRMRDYTSTSLPAPAGKTGKHGADATSLIDYCVDVATGEWRAWLDFVPHVDVPSHAVLQADAVIPTVDTLRHVVSDYFWGFGIYLARFHPYYTSAHFCLVHSAFVEYFRMFADFPSLSY